MPTLSPTARITFRGHTLDRRTARMIEWAERRAGFFFTVTQGSFNAGQVAASAGTHNGAGAVDFSVRGLSAAQRLAMVRALKNAGFAAWYRPAIAGTWPAHVHAIAIGAKPLAALAASQVKSFDAGRDGLKGNGIDKTYRPAPPVQFDFATDQPVARVVKK